MAMMFAALLLLKKAWVGCDVTYDGHHRPLRWERFRRWLTQWERTTCESCGDFYDRRANT